MEIFNNSLSALGRLLMVVALAGTFVVGMVGVVYLQLTGEEIKIPKVVGKNFNDGRTELTQNGLKIKKIASRYSTEKPNTILEQRPKAGTVAKTGLMISVVVSEKNPDGNEEPLDIKNDDEAIEEIEALPELKTNKTKKKSKSKSKKTEKNNRDLNKKKGKGKSKDDKSTSKGDTKKTEDKSKGSAKDTKNSDAKKDNKTKPKPDNGAKPKRDTTKPKSNGGSRSRSGGKSN